MASPALNEQKNRETSRQPTDEKMEQIRQILLGDHERQIEARVSILENRLERMELSLSGRLDALQARLDAISAKIDATHANTLQEIGLGIQDLAGRIRGISSNDAVKGKIAHCKTIAKWTEDD